MVFSLRVIGIELSVEVLWLDEFFEVEKSRWLYIEVREVFLVRGKKEDVGDGDRGFGICFKFFKMYIFK